MKKKWMMIFPIVLLLMIVIGICILFKQGKDLGVEEKKKDEPVEIYIKVNPLVWFKFKVEGNSATVLDFELENEKAQEIFKDVDFKNMELINAIELFGDKLVENEIKFSTIYVWTNWDNKEYFKSEKYSLDVTIEKNIEEVPKKLTEELKLGEKYYKVGDEHGYNLVFLENGVFEQHLDQNYTIELNCTPGVDINCPDRSIEITDSSYYESSKNYQYVIVDETHIKLMGKSTNPNCNNYKGWCGAYDLCEIRYNGLKCDHYNADQNQYGTEPWYHYSEYYELKNE